MQPRPRLFNSPHSYSRTFSPVECGLIQSYEEGASKEACDEAGVGAAAVTRHRGELEEAVGSHREPQGAAASRREPGDASLTTNYPKTNFSQLFERY